MVEFWEGKQKDAGIKEADLWVEAQKVHLINHKRQEDSGVTAGRKCSLQDSKLWILWAEWDPEDELREAVGECTFGVDEG